MKEYSRPVVEKLDEKAEGVYAASGDDNNETVCRYGRKQANPGVDTCQACSATVGRQSSGSYFRGDYKGCPDGMPEKN